MKRKALSDLKEWLETPLSPPLIIRGARQVGKSTLVHLFAKQEKLDLIEFNLEVEKFKSISEQRDFKIQDLSDEICLKKKATLHERSL